MAVTVSVDATWRMNRVEFSSPHAPDGKVIGYGEILLQEPAEPSPANALLQRRSPTPFAEDEERKTYGVMPAETVTRTLANVMEETVEVAGETVSFGFVMEAMRTFFEGWQAEDKETPTAMVMNQYAPDVNPVAAELTPMPPPIPPQMSFEGAAEPLPHPEPEHPPPAPTASPTEPERPA